MQQPTAATAIETLKHHQTAHSPHKKEFAERKKLNFFFSFLMPSLLHAIEGVPRWKFLILFQSFFCCVCFALVLSRYVYAFLYVSTAVISLFRSGEWRDGQLNVFCFCTKPSQFFFGFFFTLFHFVCSVWVFVFTEHCAWT